MQLRIGHLLGFALLFGSLSVNAQTTLNAVDDRAVVGNSGKVTIPVLNNDSGGGAGGNALVLVKVGKPKFGTAVAILDPKQPAPDPVIVYTAGPLFGGYDTFSYTIGENESATSPRSTGTVAIFGPGFVLAETVATTITNSSGRTVGFIEIDGMRSGVFTGKIKIGHESYALLGQLNNRGRYSGFARSENNERLSVALSISDDGDITLFKGTFGELGDWTATQEIGSLSKKKLAGLEGRYTVELPPPAGATVTDGSDDAEDDEENSDGGDVPQGSGWMTIEVNEHGEATLKGRTGDGRPFSSNAKVAGKDGQVTLPFYDVSDASTLGGTLNLSDTVDGSIDWNRDNTDEDRYPDGFDVTIATRGARYTKPKSGQRALNGENTDGGRAKLTINGGGIDEFTRELRFTEGDKVTTLDSNVDPVDIEIDRESGVFKGKFRDPDDRETRIKFTGVLLQNEGRGVGLFEAETKTGQVEFTAESPSDDDKDEDDSDDNDDEEMADDEDISDEL